MMFKNILFVLIGVVFLIVLSGGVLATTTCNAKIDWMKNASIYELNSTQNYQDNDSIWGTFDSDIEKWSISGGLKNGENLTSVPCEVGGNCLNFTYNYTNRTNTYVIMVGRPNNYGVTNALNYTGIGFWYKSDSITNNDLREVGFISNYSGGYLESKAKADSSTVGCALDSTDWKYCYIDFSLLRNGSNNIPLDMNYYESIRDILIVVYDTDLADYGSVFIDNVSLVDFDEGSIYFERWRDHRDMDRNARHNEGVVNLAYLYVSGETGYDSNETILNSTVKTMDWLARNQIWDGGWTENVNLQSSTTSSNVGFPGISFMKSLSWINTSSRLDETITIYRIENRTRGDFITDTRRNIYHDVGAKMANYTINNFVFPSGWVTNQYIARLHATWLYYNFTNNTAVLTSINNELDTINSTWQLNTFGFLPESNSSTDIGIDAGYNALTISLLSTFYADSQNGYVADILRQEDNSILNMMGWTNNWNHYILNSSRGNNFGSFFGRNKYYAGTLLNLTYLKQGSYNKEVLITGSGYGSVTGTSPFRGTFVNTIKDYLYCSIAEPADQGFKFPQNYSTYSYDLLNETAWARRNISISGPIQSRDSDEFPRMLFAYDDNSSWWVRGDYITVNGSDFIYTDENGNFTIPIVPNLRIYNFNDIQLSKNNSEGIGLNVSLNRTDFAYKGNNFIKINNNQTGSSMKVFNYDLTNALIYNTNNSIYGNSDISSNDGNINITLPPNNASYVLDNFNLTEGVTRQNSPLAYELSLFEFIFGQSKTTKKITSSLTDTINATVIFNVKRCEIDKIEYTSNTGAFNNIFSPSQFTCENNVVTLELPGIETATGSNDLVILYLPAIQDSCDALNTSFSGFILLLGLVGTILLITTAILSLLGEVKISILLTSFPIIISIGVLIIVAIIAFVKICSIG